MQIEVMLRKYDEIFWPVSSKPGPIGALFGCQKTTVTAVVVSASLWSLLHKVQLLPTHLANTYMAEISELERLVSHPDRSMSSNYSPNPQTSNLSPRDWPWAATGLGVGRSTILTNENQTSCSPITNTHLTSSWPLLEDDFLRLKQWWLKRK